MTMGQKIPPIICFFIAFSVHAVTFAIANLQQEQPNKIKGGQISVQFDVNPSYASIAAPKQAHPRHTQTASRQLVADPLITERQPQEIVQTEEVMPDITNTAHKIFEKEVFESKPLLNQLGLKEKKVVAKKPEKKIIKTAPKNRPKPREEIKKPVGIKVKKELEPKPKENKEALKITTLDTRETKFKSVQKTIENGKTENAPSSSTSSIQSKDAQANKSAQVKTDAAKSAVEGNAASTSYAGLIMRHLAKVRRPHAVKAGATLVTFTIGIKGELESAKISKRSGSPKFDRDALKVVKRGSPFPIPPADVSRTLVVEIKGS